MISRMKLKSGLALILGWFMAGNVAARTGEIYSAGETFSEPEFGLVVDIQNGDEAAARRRIAAGLDINRPVAPPAAFDFKRIFGLSPLQRRMADALTPAPAGGRADETLTLLNYFIANNDLAAMRLALKLGADPNAQGTFFHDSFRFAAEFERADALDILLDAVPFSTMSDEVQARRLAWLPRIKTVNHLFGDTEYRLAPALLEVARKHHANFNVMDPGRFATTMLTANMTLNGYDTVLWLLDNTDVDPLLPDRNGKTVAGLTAYWLDGMKPDDRERRRMVLKIKDALARKGIALP